MTELDTARDDRGVGRVRSLSVLDRALYALFARHVDAARHDRDRRRYRGTDMRISFDLYLARAYGLAWASGLFAALPTALVVFAVPDGTVDAVLDVLRAAIPLFEHVPIPVLPRFPIAAAFALGAAVVTRRVVLAVTGRYLGWRATARRENIERTLPGAVRYLHVLSSGSDGPREMLRRVAETDAYGETATAFRGVLNTASLTGNVNEGLRRVARDTPSEGMLSPFLLKFREHAGQGDDALRNYLRMESRMLGHRQDRARERAEGFLELLAELFIVLLVLPSLLVIVLTVMSVIAPGLSAPVATPLGQTTTRGIVVYASAAFIVGVGLGASLLISGLRPPDQSVEYDRPPRAFDTLTTTLTNPASAGVVFVTPALFVAGLATLVGADAVGISLAGYVAYAAPVGLVGIRRARIDDAKDRELKDFVHAVSGHVSLGRPFAEAVENVGQDVDLGPLDGDVADLALNLRFTAPSSGTDVNLRTAALERFVERVGTPMAEQTIGLVVGALDGGSDTGTVFDTLQTEIGRLYHEKRALRSGLLVYVAVGWTTALLVIGITVAVNVHVFDGFAQLSSLSTGGEFAINAGAVDLERDRYRMYVVTQATMLASGWFAGTASRGRYEAFLHSAALVVACYLVYAGVGLI
ncbi:type II secretion system, transmembrane protein TadC [Haloferax mucosum ATCC BAA-1512]|uniref:Type II secretion system, transmembrane protein TadC n=1 Tax=Haloferax mucosum ATCC BAA-1512 TaxID=662479 RepID=M0I569_9EURY|nr:type II secretion system F family protein [Haloferax mucosum]ELZ91930.1 type II secretion system, transmembrane protein TadC [Haloferax mucosum ATCC BAA-1512]